MVVTSYLHLNEQCLLQQPTNPKLYQTLQNVSSADFLGIHRFLYGISRTGNLGSASGKSNN